MSSINKNRIAKNTLLLYFRMILIMFISLYTTRVVLRTLGVEDYGILNVVGGLVVMLAFINNTMANASQRFFAFEIGKGDFSKLKQTFSLNFNLYILFSILLIIIAETLGLWFLNTQMNIPAERMSAANWVYQFSIFSTIATVLTIPFNAMIIARERMSFYAYISILESALKLLIVYLLVYFSFDKLKLYAILLFSVSIIISVIYIVYCWRKFEECRYKYGWDRLLFKEMLGYSGWNMYGMLAIVTRSHGINVLLNLFFGPVVNAARSVAYQILNALNQFITNFFTAVRPQITKSYAAGETNQMLSLLYQSSKFSYYLILVLAIPILLETPSILQLWLSEIPDYAILFSRLVVINALIDSLRLPVMASVQATGKVKHFELISGTITLLNLPASYLFLKLGYPPQTTMYISIIFSFIAQLARILIAKKQIMLSLRKYFSTVIMPIIGVTLAAMLLPMLFCLKLDASIGRMIFTTLLSFSTSAIVIWLLGLTQNERKVIQEKMRHLFLKRKS